MKWFIKLLIFMFFSIVVIGTTYSFTALQKDFAKRTITSHKISDTKKNKFTQSKEILANQPINLFFEDHNDNLWVGTEGNGLWEKHANQATFAQNSFLPKKSSINTIIEDHSKNILIGTDEHGLWRQSAGKEAIIQDSSVLASLNIGVITEDDANNIWVGTKAVGPFAVLELKAAGLWEKKADKSLFEQNIDIPNTVLVDNIFEDQCHNMWFGTDGSGFNGYGLWEQKRGEDTITQIHATDNNNKQFTLDEAYISIIFQDSFQNIFIGTRFRGLWEKPFVGNDKDTFIKLDLGKNEALTTTIKILFQETDSTNLWLVTDSSELLKGTADAGKITFVMVRLPKNYFIDQLLIDGQKNLWLGTEANGLWERPANKETFVQNNVVAPHIHIESFFQDNHKSIWIGTTKMGVWEQKSNDIYSVPTPGTTKYDEKSSTYFQTNFFVFVNNPNAASIVVGSKRYQNVDFDLPIILSEHSKYKVQNNKWFHFSVSDQSGTSLYDHSFYIKTKYFNNVNGSQENIRNALTSTGGKGLTQKTIYLKGHHTPTYQLLSNLASNQSTNPLLTILSTKLNYLTDYQKSTIAKIVQIKDGKFITAKADPLLPDKNYVITGAKTNNIWLVNLQDKVGNKSKFIIQVGGQKLNKNFIVVKNNNIIGIIVGVITGLIIVLLIIWVAYKRFIGSNNRNKINGKPFYMLKNDVLSLGMNKRSLRVPNIKNKKRKKHIKSN